MYNTSMSHNGGLPNKRTRGHVGTTNRKRIQGDSTPETRSRSASLTPTRRSPPRSPKNSIMQGTASSIKLHEHSKSDNDKKVAQRLQLDTMRCKFVECFEDGKNIIKVGTVPHDPDAPPTRFSSAPPPRDTSFLTSGEEGTSSYITESQRLATTYNTTIHTYSPPNAPSPFPRKKRQPQIIDETAVQKTKAKEREAGRLARIRDNNARVEAASETNHILQSSQLERRIATVKRQQESYAKAIAERQALGLD